MARRVAGIAYIKVNGTQLEVSGGVEAPVNDLTRETVMGLSGVAGYKEMYRTPSAKVTAIFRDDFPMELLVGHTDMTVTMEFPNGKVYTLSPAYLVSDSTAKADDGTIELEFQGDRGIWQ